MRKKWMLGAASVAAALSIAAGSANAATYTVKSGDFLWKIASENSITVQQLMDMNHLTSYMIYPGQQLQVPDRYATYVVQPGDVYWKISMKLGVPIRALVNANPQITDPNNIWPGLKMNVPDKPAALQNGRFPLAKGTYKPFTDNYGVTREWTPNGMVTRGHEGVDISADKGTPVYSVMAGKVVNYGWNEYGGWRLTVQVDSTNVFYYAHLSKYAPGIGMGSQISQGQLIGYVGNTGYGPEGTEGKFEPHLHFGIYKSNSDPWTTVDPYQNLRWWELLQ
jgi:murein DD-endopeptidase MepM/ murein hydrolase activator NlpD